MSLSVNGQTALYGIIGKPLSHSFSPIMHSLAFQEIGINAVYLPFPVDESQLPQLLDAFWVMGVKGFNVTVPYKEKIIPWLTTLSSEAEALGSVNTVHRQENGWKGYSTDGNGFIRSLEAAGLPVSGKTAMLIGAGGAARAVALSLSKAGVSELTISNRTPQKAREIADMVQRFGAGCRIHTDIPSNTAIDLLVNCTSVGMKDSNLPVSKALIQRSGFVVDIIYNPAQTELLKQAEQYGIPTLNGLGMLLYQGVAAFEIWTRQKAPIEQMKRALLKTLAENSS